MSTLWFHGVGPRNAGPRVHYGRSVLSTLLTRLPWLAFSVLVLALVLAPLVGAWLASKPRLTRVLLAVVAVVMAALTLYPDGAPSAGVACALQLPYLAPTASETMANILLFLPLSFLIGLVWRRPVVAMLIGAAASAAIEAVQALVPAIGRACDTSDLINNAIGAVLGGACAWGALLIRRALDARRRGAAQERIDA